eukprot:6213394-Pleurochrysis_carterae.AAC.1
MLYANQASEREREARRRLLDKDHDPRTSESEDESMRPLEPYINIWPDSDDSDPDDWQWRVIMNNVRYNRRRAKRRQRKLAEERARACESANRAPTAEPSACDGLVTPPRQPATKQMRRRERHARHAADASSQRAQDGRRRQCSLCRSVHRAADERACDGLARRIARAERCDDRRRHSLGHAARDARTYDGWPAA